MMDGVIQRNRIYMLKVGDSKRGWTITNLNISFDVTKVSSNKDKVNSASVTIYNLSQDKRMHLEEAFIEAHLYVGYVGTGLIKLFTGQVTEVTNDKRGEDVTTKLDIANAFTEINYKTLSKLVPAGRTVKDVIEEVVKSIPSVSRAVFTGSRVDSEVLDGYPIHTTARRTLDDLSRSYLIDWQIDNDILYINDKEGSHTRRQAAKVVSPSTGLIGSPTSVVLPTSTKKKRTREQIKDSKTERISKDGVKFKHLLDPTLVAGSIIKIEDEVFSGYYKIRDLRSYGEWLGTDWYSDVTVERM